MAISPSSLWTLHQWNSANDIQLILRRYDGYLKSLNSITNLLHGTESFLSSWKSLSLLIHFLCLWCNPKFHLAPVTGLFLETKESSPQLKDYTKCPLHSFRVNSELPEAAQPSLWPLESIKDFGQPIFIKFCTISMSLEITLSRKFAKNITNTNMVTMQTCVVGTSVNQYKELITLIVGYKSFDL